jgi:hypothetical protein
MSITCDGSACSSAWYDGAVSVTVSGIDSGTGMGSVTRKVDNGSQNSTAGASVTFNVSGNSAGHTVLYFGTDAAGNAASNTTITIKIDGAAPVAAKNVSGTAGQQNGEIDLTWTAGTDALSGVAYQTIHRSAAGTGNCPATTTANYPTAYAATATATAQTVGGLVSGASYCFYVETVDNAGNTKDSTKSARIVAN